VARSSPVPLRRGPFARLKALAPPAALARVFDALHRNATATTRGLTRALGVSGLRQQDAQEYLRLLVCALLESPCGADVEKVYGGSVETYLEATAGEEERLGERPRRTRAEAFLDVSLDVAGADDVHGALKAYLAPELLAGANRWRSDAGPVDAFKGVRFATLPPVLVLHLKRFAYDFNYDAVRKVGRRVAVPFRLPAGAFEAPAEEEEEEEEEEGDAPDAPEDEAEAAPPDLPGDAYALQAVVIHAGGGTGGHYYAYVDPNLDGRWVKFDDDRVTPVDAATVAAEASGADHGGGYSTGAYLLQYVRERDAAELGFPAAAAGRGAEL